MNHLSSINYNFSLSLSIILIYKPPFSEFTEIKAVNNSKIHTIHQGFLKLNSLNNPDGAGIKLLIVVPSRRRGREENKIGT